MYTTTLCNAKERYTDLLPQPSGYFFEKNVHSVDTGPVIEDAGVEVEAEVEVGQEVEITPVFHLI